VQGQIEEPQSLRDQRASVHTLIDGTPLSMASRASDEHPVFAEITTSSALVPQTVSPAWADPDWLQDRSRNFCLSISNC